MLTSQGDRHCATHYAKVVKILQVEKFRCFFKEKQGKSTHY